MSESADECPKCAAGAPAWVMTFADLMSLLMCFFVLLLSFATMDVIRFKQMATSLKNAFGVQTEIIAYEVVKGTSVIAQHFTPATVEPTPLDEIRQSTTEELPNLEIPESTLEKTQDGKGEMDKEEMEKRLAEEQRKELEAEAARIRESLMEEIKAGRISVETKENKIIVRIHERGSFPSGSAVLNSGFSPVMKKIVEVVKRSRGKVIVAGHTDNVPIHSEWYRSNWELAAARAVTVAHELLKGGVDPKRLMVAGYADTRPLVPNTTAANRAKNRRVEIILEQEKGEALSLESH